MHKGFPPIYDKNSKILILGSFPSVKSRLDGFYYAHPQNRFWKMLSQVFSDQIFDEIEEKKKFLIKHNIALYDVVAESNLQGSADETLRKSYFLASEIDFLLPPNTKVKKILCNGKTAFQILTRHENVKEENGNYFYFAKEKIPIICLSSTSSANPRYSFQQWEDEIKTTLI